MCFSDLASRHQHQPRSRQRSFHQSEANRTEGPWLRTTNALPRSKDLHVRGQRWLEADASLFLDSWLSLRQEPSPLSRTYYKTDYAWGCFPLDSFSPSSVPQLPPVAGTCVCACGWVRVCASGVECARLPLTSYTCGRSTLKVKNSNSGQQLSLPPD